MPVAVCSACKVKINVKDEMLGKKAKCPKCAASIVLRTAGDSEADEPAPKPKRKPEKAQVEEVEDNPFAAFETEESDAPPKRSSNKRPPAKNAFALDEEEPSAAFEAVDDDAPPKRSSSKRPPPKNAFALDEEEPSAAFEPVEDDDEVSPEKERPRGKKSRNDDLDEEEKPRKKMKVSARFRGAGPWAEARSGLQIIFFGTCGFLTFFILIQLLSIAMTIMLGNAMNQDFGRRGAGRAIENVQIIASLNSYSVLGLLCSAVAVFYGLVICCFAPRGTIARLRARISVNSYLGSFVVATFGSIFVAAFALPGMNRGPFGGHGDSQAAALALFATVAIIQYAAYAFAILFHAAIADEFENETLKSKITVFLIAALASPFAILLIWWLIAWSLASTSPVAAQVASSIFLLVTISPLIVWYIMVNRKVVQLIDVRA